MDLMHLIENLMTSPLIYPAIFTLVMLDAIIPLLPSETVVIAAGVFAASGKPLLPLVVVAAALGAFAGDHLGYGIGRALRQHRPSGRLIRAATKAAPHLHTRGGSLIMAGRFIPGGRTAVITACGATGYPIRRFTTFTATAAAAWSLYAATLGILGGAAFEANPLLGLALGLGLAFGVTALGELIRHLRRPSHRDLKTIPRA